MSIRAEYLDRTTADPWANADPDAVRTVPLITARVRALHCPGCGQRVDRCVCPDTFGDLVTPDEVEIEF